MIGAPPIVGEGTVAPVPPPVVVPPELPVPGPPVVPVVPPEVVPPELIEKLANTESSAFIVRLQARLPVHPMVQLLKAEPAAAVAVSVTGAPLEKIAEQAVPQAIPAGLLVTVPAPKPSLTTVSVVWL